MKGWKALAAAAAFVTAFGIGHTTAVAQQTVWQYGGVLPGAFWIVKDMSEEGERWLEATDGRLKVNVLPSGSSGVTGPDQLSAASENILQVSEAFGSRVAGQERVLEMLDLPFFVPYDLDFREKLATALFDDYAKIFEEKYNVWLLGFQQLLPRTLFTKQKVASLDDVKGLKVRAIGPADSDFTRAMGMVATTTNWGEVYSTIQQGTIDGVWSSEPGALAMKFYEVAPYAYNAGNAGPTYFIVINKDALNDLPADVREYVMGRRDEFHSRRFAKQREVRENIRVALEKAGAEIHDPTPAEVAAMEKLAAPIIEEWATKLSPQTRPLYEKAKAMIAEYKASMRK